MNQLIKQTDMSYPYAGEKHVVWSRHRPGTKHAQKVAWSNQGKAMLAPASGSARLFYCLFVAALVLYGSSTLQSIAQSVQTESTPAENNAIPAPTAVDFPRPVDAESPRVTVLEDTSIFFPPGSTTVDDIRKEKLRQHAEYLKLNPVKIVTLVGYTDGRGNRNYNLAITEERLTAVSKWLRACGVLPGQIQRSNIGHLKRSTMCGSTDCK